MTKPPLAQGEPYRGGPMFEHPRYRREWVNEPAVRAIWVPLTTPGTRGTRGTPTTARPGGRSTGRG